MQVSFIRAEMWREKVPGVAAGIFQHGEIVMAKGYGYSNVELQVPGDDQASVYAASYADKKLRVELVLAADKRIVQLDISPLQ